MSTTTTTARENFTLNHYHRLVGFTVTAVTLEHEIEQLMPVLHMTNHDTGMSIDGMVLSDPEGNGAGWIHIEPRNQPNSFNALTNALATVLEAAEVRRDQWQAAVDGKAETENVIRELFEADDQEARDMVQIYDQAIAQVQEVIDARRAK
jgi:hypothetical protein